MFVFIIHKVICPCFYGLPCIYTECQNKLITSSERHSYKSKELKWIIIGNRSAIIVLLIKHIWKKSDWVNKNKKSKIRWNCKRSLKKSHKLLSFQAQTIARTAVTQSAFEIECSEQAAICGGFQRAVSVIFEQWLIAISLHFSPFWQL